MVKVYFGKQGKNPGYDPLKIMTQVAHANGMKIEAWINPYRVASGSTNYKKLSTKIQQESGIIRKRHAVMF